MSKRKIIFIESYVYVSERSNIILLFNSINNKYYFTQSVLEYNFINELVNNNCILSIDEHKIESSINSLINLLKSLYIIEITEEQENSPFYFPYLFKLKNEINPINQTLKRGYNHLNEITMFLKDYNYQNNLIRNNSLFEGGYKQFYFPKLNYDNKNIELDYHIIEKLFETIAQTNCIVNIVGDILSYSSIQELLILLEKSKLIISVYVLIDQAIEIKNIFQKSNSLIYNILLYDLKSYSTKKYLENTIIEANNKFIFIVQNQDELAIAQEFISLNNINNALLIPFYNKNNFSFFKNSVFTNKDEILSNEQTIDAINLNKHINLFHYGKFTILSDANVYTNINCSPIGNLYENSILELINYEFLVKSAWFLTRKNCEPCKNCFYCDLCTPISNYEFVLEKNNLCNL